MTDKQMDRLKYLGLRLDTIMGPFPSIFPQLHRGGALPAEEIEIANVHCPYSIIDVNGIIRYNTFPSVIIEGVSLAVYNPTYKQHMRSFS